MKTGIVLTGGGARAAYQAGVLKALSEILPTKQSPFSIISGISAGAINGLWLAGKSDNFPEAAAEMWDAWANIQVEQVYRTDTLSLLSISSSWIRDLSFGGLFGKSRSTYLLDSSPLKNYLASKIDFSQIRKLIHTDTLHGISVSATCYGSGASTAFFQGKSPEWSREKRLGIRTDLKIEHIMASTAIPIFFPPVKVSDSFYGDGMVQLTCPLSPAIHLGAERILSIGLHCPTDSRVKRNSTISVGDIMETLLNGLFFGSLSADRERLERINRTVDLLTSHQRRMEPDQLKKIPLLAIDPSESLGNLANYKFSQFPIPLRHLLKGIGVTDKSGSDILSYLAFDSLYTKTLLSLGYKDGHAKKREILEFFAH